MQKRRRNAKSGRNIKKMHPFLFSQGMSKRVIFRGVANVAVLGSWIYTYSQKMSSGKERCNFWLIIVWFFRYLAGLWMAWLVCRLFGCGVAGLWMVWLVCGWFADGLVGLWVVWVVFGWFTVGLQQTKLFLLKKNRKASS